MRAEDGDFLESIPPHPARGSDTHRVVVVVLEHSSPVEPSQLFNLTLEKNNTPLYQNRIVDLRMLLKREDIQLSGYQFYRTCWTQKVSQFYADLSNIRNYHFTFVELTEPVFGDILPPRLAPRYKYSNA